MTEGSENSESSESRSHCSGLPALHRYASCLPTAYHSCENQAELVHAGDSRPILYQSAPLLYHTVLKLLLHSQAKTWLQYAAGCALLFLVTSSTSASTRGSVSLCLKGECLSQLSATDVKAVSHWFIDR